MKNTEVEDFVEINIEANKSIHLPHILVHWTDGELNPRCTLYIWMLSGLEPRDITAKILEGGETLRVTLPWPDPLHDAMRMNGQSICDDSVKIVNMEKAIKGLKGGLFDSTIYSVVDVKLGMKVEEQFHNEPIARGKVEKGNKVLRFVNRVYNRKKEKAENVPILISKFEMMGHKDSYRTISTADSDYEDEYATVCDGLAKMAVPSADRDPTTPPSPKKRKTTKIKKRVRSTGKVQATPARLKTGTSSVKRPPEPIETFHTPTTAEGADGNPKSFSFPGSKTYRSMDLEKVTRDLITQKGGKYLKSFLFGKDPPEKKLVEDAVDELIRNVSDASNEHDDIDDYYEYEQVHGPEAPPADHEFDSDEEMEDGDPNYKYL